MDIYFVIIFLVTDDDSEAWAPLSGQLSLSGAEANVSFSCVVLS